MIPLPPRIPRALPGVSFVLAVLCAGSSHVAAQSPEPESIAWQDQYGQALDDARASNRPLWIQFTGPWCPNCTRMERESFPQPPIVEHARRSFVPLKLRSDLNEQLVLGFGITGLPASIIVAPNRDIIAIRQGYLGPDELDAFLSDALARCPVKTAADFPLIVSITAIAGTALVTPDIRASALKGDNQSRKEKPVALAGFCVVSLVCDRKLVAGRAEHSVTHEGRIYRFSNPLMSERFRKEPQRFIPANDGHCPVTQVEHGLKKPGDPRFGVLLRGRLFLCASTEHRQRFLDDPASFELVDVAENGFCAHCIRDNGLLVPGDPRHEVALRGRRFWFPDSGHREAFLTTVR